MVELFTFDELNGWFNNDVDDVSRLGLEELNWSELDKCELDKVGLLVKGEVLVNDKLFALLIDDWWFSGDECWIKCGWCANAEVTGNKLLIAAADGFVANGLVIAVGFAIRKLFVDAAAGVLSAAATEDTGGGGATTAIDGTILLLATVGS